MSTTPSTYWCARFPDAEPLIYKCIVDPRSGARCHFVWSARAGTWTASGFDPARVARVGAEVRDLTKEEVACVTGGPG